MTQAIDPGKIDEIIRFWFEESKSSQWYQKDDAFDQQISSRFGGDVSQALAGKLESWSGSASGCMALILLLDQFPRNIFRDHPDAFAGDGQAVALSLKCVKQGYIDEAGPAWRQFMLMPLMHSEKIEVQDASLKLFDKYTSKEILDYAVRHRDIIARFGRFPHRNAILGRPSTPEELQFLQEKGSSF